MTNANIDLSYAQVAGSAGLLLANAGISLALQLGLERRLLWVASRMCVQLLLVGLVLHWVFSLDSWPAVAGIAIVMTIVAGVSAVERVEHRLEGIHLNSIISVWTSTWLVTLLALLAIIQVQPWHRAQFSIPLLGMILGNTLNGITLGLDRFGKELHANRPEIETHLALGATSWEAALKSIREAVRTGLTPMLNSMAIAGIVSLPGMMTGQMTAGINPMAAVRYQIVIMFLVAAGSAIGCVSVVLLSYRRAFSASHQLRIA